MNITPTDLAKMLRSNPDLRVDSSPLRDDMRGDIGMITPHPTEHDLQVAVIAECDRRAVTNPLWGMIYAIPNGGQRSKAQGGKLKAEGVRAGMPDLCLPVARHGYHGLYIELKVGDNKPSADQQEQMRKLREQGYCCLVIWDSAADAVQAMRLYLEGQ